MYSLTGWRPLRLGGRRRLAAAVLISATAAVGSCSSPTSPLPNNQVATAQLTVKGVSALSALGQTAQLTVADAAGNVLTAGVSWRSTTPGVATVSPAGLVTATGFGSSTILAEATNAIGSIQVVVGGPGSTTTSLTSCTTLTAAGSYSLSSDLVPQFSGTASCLQVNQTGAVRIDCAGHTVPSVGIQAANSVTVSNCVVPKRFGVSQATNITLTNLVAAQISIQGSTNVSLTNSMITSPATGGNPPVFATQDTNLIVQGNVITTTAAVLYAVYLADGTGNQILGNTISGGYDGGTALVGSDDGVLMIDEVGDTVRGNQIQNFFDAGVEGVNLFANVTVADNTMTTIGAAGVSSYWCTDWTNNVIRNNTVTQAPLLLYVNYSIGGPQCGLAGSQNGFSGNQIIGNRFRTPITGTLGFVPAPTGSLSTQGPIARIIVAFPPPVSNNVIQGNDLGANDGPFLLPLNGFTDGGGNLCGPTNPQISNFPCAGVGTGSVARRR